MTGSQQGGHAVIHTVPASLIPAHLCHWLIVLQHGKGGTIRVIQPIAQGVVFTEAFNLAPAAFLQCLLQGGFAMRKDEPPGGRHGANQVVELGLDSGQIGKDIRVVEFQIVENDGARTVVNEFAALVEEGGVVFIRFHHKKRRLTESGRDPEIAGHTTNQITGIEPGVLQNPGQHGAGRGLAVGTGHRQHPAPGQDHILQQLGTGGIGQAPIQHGFHGRIAPTQGIADHHQIRRRLQLRRVVPLGQCNARRFQLVTHGRIDVLVTTGNTMALSLGQLRQRAHEGATDTEDMDMHGNKPIKRIPAP